MNDTKLRYLRLAIDEEVAGIAFDASLEEQAQLLHRGMRDYLQPFPTMRVANCVAGISTEDLERELDELAGSIYRADEVL